MKRKGITLIETILYLGLAVIVLGVLFSYGWNIVGISVKAQVAQETTVAAQLVADRLAAEIRQADSVNRGSSVFGSAPAKLVLESSGETVTIEDSANKIMLKRGLADPAALNARNIKIENLVFTEQISALDETQYVGFSFDAVANYPGSTGRSEYQYSLPIRSGSALRTSH